MNFHKWLIGSAIAVSAVALAACGSDSSSNSSGDNGGSSSSGAVVIPVTSDSGWVAVSGLGAEELSSETVRIKGVASAIDTVTDNASVHLDSLKFILKDASGKQVDQLTLTLDGKTQLTIANGIFSGAATGNVATCSSDTSCTNVNFSYNLSATINTASSALSSCGEFKVYAVAYGSDSSNKVNVASDSATFNRSQDYCNVASSSSAAVSSSSAILMTSFTATLTTETVGVIGVDLDAQKTFASGELAANADAVDLILTYKNGTAALVNAQEYGLTSSAVSQIGEELSGNRSRDAVNALSFTYGTLGSTTGEDLFSNSVWVVKTPSYNATTMKGFFVLDAGIVSTGATVTVPLTIWYVQ
jgi:hypothetical protein